MSGLQEVDLVFFVFLSHFYFIFSLFSFILFLEPGLGSSDDITQSYISHIR